jgi:23S rRNA pseudouridine1911/1915/1917 synthase
MTTQIFRLVFDDSSILVIEKLKPFLSQKGDRGEGEGLHEFIERTQGEKIYPVHRLDREVLGLMIFGKTQKAADELSQQFKQRTVEKCYEAVVWGRVRDDSGSLVHYLKKNSKTNYVTVFPRPTEGAKKAELSFKVIERLEGSTKLLIELKTGRSHQIRVQLAKIGHPIVGDEKYGGRREIVDMPRIRLKSIRLAINHPKTGDRMAWSLEASEAL